MANEILFLDVSGNRSDGERLNLLFFYPVSSAGSVSAQTLVLTPYTELPLMARPAVTASQRSALDSGLMAFESATYDYRRSLTASQNTSAITTLYATQYSAFTLEYSRRFRLTGLSIGS